jgi:ribose 5-phosphate isomerase B
MSKDSDIKGLTIHVAADHAGFAHKEAVKAWLTGEGFKVKDHGAFSFDAEDDFPRFIAKAARAVAAARREARAVVFGGSGQGEAMCANRLRGVRAAVYYGGDDAIVALSREHNDANVLSVGARFVDINETKRVIWLWLHTKPRAEAKYARRNRALDRISSRT